MMIAVSKFPVKWQEYPDMDEGWVEQTVWFGVCTVFHTAASVEVIQCVLFSFRQFFYHGYYLPLDALYADIKVN